MIRPGEILLLDLPIVDPPHDKFVLVLAVSPDAFFAFINSNISPFLAARPNMRNVQVTIDAAAHRFLNYDSYINCAEPFFRDGVDLQLIEEQLRIDPWRRKGACSTVVLEQVLDALENARTVSQHIRDAVRTALRPLIDDSKF